MKINSIKIGTDNANKLYLGSDIINKIPFQVEGGQVLPYDAEIEYLESDAASYINTSIYLNTSNFEIGYECIGGDELQWGYAHQGNGGGAWISVTNTKALMGTFNNSVGISSYWNASGNNTVKYSNSGVTLNGRDFSKNFSASVIDDISNVPIPIFGWYDFNASAVDCGKVNAMKSFYIKNNDVLVFDAIPVRVGQVGYMYDRVSGQLLGNQGTGNFVLGNDITPTPQTTIDYWQYVEMGSTPPTPPEPHDYSQDYLTLVAETNNMTVRYIDTNSNTLQYSVDSGSTWNNLSNGQYTTAVNNGDKVLFKATGLTVGGEVGIGTLRPTASASVEGNIMSLAYGDNFTGQTVIPNNFQFRKLFSGATNITSAENMVLPATTIKKQCYSQMFQGCTSLVTAPKKVGEASMTWDGDYIMSDMFNSCSSLTTAPELPATTLGTQCYWYMFEGCTSLEKAPSLPAPTAANQCYQGMFSGCTSLNYVECLLTTGQQFNEWLYGVASSGTFVRYPNASWRGGTNGIPNGWTIVDYGST